MEGSSAAGGTESLNPTLISSLQKSDVTLHAWPRLLLLKKIEVYVGGKACVDERSLLCVYFSIAVKLMPDGERRPSWLVKRTSRRSGLVIFTM